MGLGGKLLQTPSRKLPSILALSSWLWLSVGGCGGDSSDAVTLHEWLTNLGVDVTELFAPPTTAEIDAIREDWRDRELGAVDVRIEAERALPAGETLRVLSHMVGQQTHYGLVILPPGDHDPGSLPVLANFIGFGRVLVLDVPDTARAYDSRFVTMLPSFRGHELRVGDESWFSDGDPYDQCDGGTDDAIAFLEAALSMTPEADPSTLIALGGSRGGNVAMLAGIRREDVDGVANIAGPTDYLRPELLDHPNMTALYTNYFVRDLLAGVGTIPEARRRMLACSPLHFAEALPPMQAHHGTADENVPFEQAELLATRMRDLGRVPPEFQLFAYEGADHALVEELTLISERIEKFIDRLEPVPPPALQVLTDGMNAAQDARGVRHVPARRPPLAYGPLRGAP